MKLKTLTLFLWVVLIAGAAIAGEERQTRIEIVVEEVRFIDSSELSVDANNRLRGDHGVHIIERETTVTS